jgi:hypothetical protein
MTSTSLIKPNGGLINVLATGGLAFDVFSKEITLLDCLVSGTSFRYLEDIEPELAVGSKLQLKREVKNEHDGFAVAVWLNKEKIGYLPKAKNETVARLMDAGKEVFASVTDKEWEGTWLKINVKVVGRF